MYLDHWELVLRLLLATLLGLLFGRERKRSKKQVGARTHILVCLASCVIALISAYGFEDIHRVYPASVNINIDPARLVVGVLTGVGVLGGGIIWKSPSGSIQGITTAAEIFLLATLGIACGLGLYLLTAVATVIGLVTLVGDSVAEKVRSRKKEKHAEKPEEELAQEEISEEV